MSAQVRLEEVPEPAAAAEPAPEVLSDDAARLRQAAIALSGLGVLAGVVWWRFLAFVGVHATSDSAAYFLGSLRLTWGQAAALSPSWPPIYPGLLWLLGAVTPYPADAAALISGLAAAMVVGGVGVSALSASRSPLVAVSATLLCCVWGSLLFVFRYAWSEPLYTGFTMVHIAFVARHIRTGRLRDYALAAVFAACAAGTRYIGDSLILVFAVYTAGHLLRTRADLRAWGAHAVAGILPMLPLAAWLLWNFRKTGHLHGARSPARRTLSENVGYFQEVVVEQLWSTPLLSTALAGAVLLAVVGLWREPASPPARLARYALACAVLYAGLLLYATSTVAMNRISPRLTMPVLPVLLVFLTAAVGGARRLLSARGQVGLGIATAAILACAAVANMPAWHRALDPSIQAIDGKSSHELAGFDASRTADEINALLVERLREQPHLAATVMTQTRSGHKGLSMWTRSATFEGRGLSLVGYDVYQDKKIPIRLTLDGQPREVSVWLHAALEDADDITAELLQMIESTGELEVLVITRQKVLREAGVPGADLAQLPSPVVRCAPVEKIDSYGVYSCSL